PTQRTNLNLKADRTGMSETPKRPASDPPPQPGSATAVSSSADNLRPGDTLVPPGRSDQTMVPPTRSDETVITGAGGKGQSTFRTRIEGMGGWGETNPELAPGTTLANRYEILAVLGTGGMGSVYKAQDKELDRLVALKVIRPDLARNPAIVDRFKQEI